MTTKPEPRGMAECTCARIGYALFLCQEHAPIPYTVTVKGRREVDHLKQWDVIAPLLRGRKR